LHFRKEGVNFLKTSLPTELRNPLQLLIDALPDGVMILNTQGIIELTNKAQETLNGLTKKQLIGQSMIDLVHMNLYSDPIIDLVLKRKTRVTLMQNTPMQTCLMVTGTPVIHPGGRIAFVVVYSKDVTKLNELQQQLKRTEQLTQRYSSELSELRAQQNENIDMVANSEEMRRVIDLTLRVARVDTTILILGESGVGKELFAKTIHDQSPRKLNPFIKINCSALPESLIESELFGYEPGTFTGGKKEGKAGLFELADNGDIFLDEIGELPLALQPKLLRVLQEKEVVRLGGAKSRKVDIRIIAATNKDLRELVKQKQFREDLFFRLNVVPIIIPPLRERKDDIIPLIFRFKDYYCTKHNLKKDFSGKVLTKFFNYDWPGNVRELQNVVERVLIVSSPNTNLIELEDIPSDLLPDTNAASNNITVHGILPMKAAVSELEKQLIAEAMKKFGSTSKVAEVLGVHQTTVIRKLHKNKNKTLTCDLAEE
jgi:PAS domain S-box-containing protein